MRHGLQLAGSTLLWLVSLNTDWDCLVPHCIMGLCDRWKFSPFFRPQWPSLCRAQTAGKCLSAGLCKGTVKESTTLKTQVSCQNIYQYQTIQPNNHFNSSKLIYTHLFNISLVQIMAHHTLGPRPVSGAMLAHYQLDPWEQTSIKFESK